MGRCGTDHLVNRIRTINVGSSTLKCGVLDDGRDLPSAEFRAQWSGASPSVQTRSVGEDWSAPRAFDQPGDGDALVAASEAAIRWAGDQDARRSFDAITHRLVHGGGFATPQWLNTETLRELERWSHAAPLHQPGALATIDRFARRFGNHVQIGCFDTSFFRDLPERSKTFAVPAKWSRRYGLRRFGFHGLSHQYVRDEIGTVLPDRLRRRVITCHLGSGCSVAAIQDGRAVDTTMGWTPMSGLMMGTRSGSIDADVVLHLIREHGLKPAEIAHELTHHSGLLGVSQRTADFRELSIAADDGQPDAELAKRMFEDSVTKAIASMAAVLGGIDILAMTGGIGQNDCQFRQTIADRLSFLGLDQEQEFRLPIANAQGDLCRGVPAGPIRVVIDAREDLTMRRQAITLLRSMKAGGPRRGDHA